MVVTELIVRFVVSTPVKWPPFTRFVPLCCHWYVNEPVPVAPTVKLAELPAQIVTGVGFVLIVGGRPPPTTIRFACVLLLLPSGPVAVRITV